MNINRQLIRKYNQPVPRYTSYPPANFFSDNFGTEDYLKAIEVSNNDGISNISLYVHIPFCKKMCYYCGCNSCPIASNKNVPEYIDALKKEINMLLPLLDSKRMISQVHYGGGTPNAIPVKYLEEINQLFFSKFELTKNAEIAIECHPAYLDEDYIEGLKRARFNRFSLGLQDFNLEVLNAVNREPSKMPLDKLVSLLRYDESVAVNFDFIYGLPKQTKSSFIETIKKAISYKPDRLVTFSYAHVPWVNKAQTLLEKIGLPDEQEKIDMTESAYNLLEENGYKSIGMDHYVLETDVMYKAQQSGNLHRNFQGYCTRETTGQVYAFGVSGISQLDNSYIQNTKSISEYISGINNGDFAVTRGYSLSKNDSVIRRVIAQFMCNKKINWKNLAESLNITSDELRSIINYDNQALQQFESDQIIELSDETIQITDNGLPFIRNVAASFDPLIKDTNKTFSKSI
jgi:oxygen-independent coproporphyrinogen-3 oxidase